MTCRLQYCMYTDCRVWRVRAWSVVGQAGGQDDGGCSPSMLIRRALTWAPAQKLCAFSFTVRALSTAPQPDNAKILNSGRTFHRLFEANELRRVRDKAEALLKRGNMVPNQMNHALKAYLNSSEMRAFVKRAEAHGVVPNLSTYNMLLTQIRIEGGSEEELATLQQEMRDRGLEPNENTNAALVQSQSSLSRQRTTQLVRRLKSGDRQGTLAMFDVLFERGAVEEYHTSVAMHACLSSEEQQSLKQRVEAAGMALGASAYDTMSWELRMESDSNEEAIVALRQEMRARGIEEGERIKQALSLKKQDVSKERTSKLLGLLKAGDRREMLAFFIRLLDNRSADEYQLNVALMACANSVQQRWLVQRAESSGVKLSEKIYASLLLKLRLEGLDEEEAVLALQQEMSDREIEAKERFKAVIDKTKLDLSKLRTVELNALVNSGDGETALALFDVLLEQGAAESYHLNVALKACSDSTEQTLLKQRAEAAGVVPSLRTYGTLLKTLHAEGPGNEETVAAMKQEMRERGIQLPPPPKKPAGKTAQE